MSLNLLLLIDDTANPEDFIRYAKVVTTASQLIDQSIAFTFSEKARVLWEQVSITIKNPTIGIDVSNNHSISIETLKNVLSPGLTVITSITQVNIESLVIAASSLPITGSIVARYPIMQYVPPSIVISSNSLLSNIDQMFTETIEQCISAIIKGLSLNPPITHFGALQDSNSNRDPAVFTGNSISEATIELSIVVPTLDVTSERFRRMYDSIQRNTNVPYQIIVVENGKFPQGYTDPVNTAIRGVNTRYVTVMNDDVQVLDNWWEPLRNNLDNGKGVVFPTTIGGTREDFSAWCFAFIKVELLRVLGTSDLFNPIFKIWYQDTDLMLRLMQIGNPPYHVNNSFIHHHTSSTVATEDITLASWIRDVIKKDEEAFKLKWPEVSFASN